MTTRTSGARPALSIALFAALVCLMGCEPTVPSSKSCGKCAGCCDRDGVCQLGLNQDACGAGGVACALCGASASCVDGVCQAGLGADGSSACGGCVDGQSCVSGNDDGACGKGGTPCVDCTLFGQACVDGRCGGCSCVGGCCDGADTCQPGNTDSACGRAGGACVDCSKQGAQCDATTGQCASCDATSCPGGCCKGGVCVPGNADYACGKGGAACDDCLSKKLVCGTSRQCEQLCNCSSSPNGCCLKKICVSGIGDTACGGGGARCVDCAAAGGTCDANTRICTGGCPNCVSGCCEGSTCRSGKTDALCGKDGQVCVNCTSLGKTCHPVRKQCE